MKNNRLTNEDILKLKAGLERIHELASFKNARFDMDDEKDKKIKNKMGPYMMWFDCVANAMEELLNGKEKEYYHFR